MKLFVGNKEVSYLSLGNNEISAEIIDKYFENLSERALEFSDISDTECYVTAKKEWHWNARHSTYSKVPCRKKGN